MLQTKITPRNTSYSSGNTIKLQHEVTIISEQNDIEVKILAMKPINSSKAKNTHDGTWAQNNGHSKFSIKAFSKNYVVTSESQKTPADPKLKTLYQVTQKKVR